MIADDIQIDGLESDEAKALLGVYYEDFVEIKLVRGTSHEFDLQLIWPAA